MTSIEIPIAFAQRFSLKADVRVKLTQFKGPDNLEKQQVFHINSRPFRISVPPDKAKGRLVIKGNDFTFLVDKLEPRNLEEIF